MAIYYLEIWWGKQAEPKARPVFPIYSPAHGILGRRGSPNTRFQAT